MLNIVLVLVLVKCYDNKMILLPYYLSIFPLVKPEATNQPPKKEKTKQFEVHIQAQIWFVLDQKTEKLISYACKNNQLVVSSYRNFQLGINLKVFMKVFYQKNLTMTPPGVKFHKH